MRPTWTAWLKDWCAWGRRRVAGPRFGLRPRPRLGAERLEDRVVPAFTGGVYVAAGDVDGDGVGDIVTGPGIGGEPVVRVVGGRDGRDLPGATPYERSFTGGVQVAAGDTDRDGAADLVVGTGVGGGPRVQVLGGRDRRVLSDFFAYEDSFRGGVQVAAGDVDADGYADIVTGTSVGGGPRVRVFSGKTGAVLSDFFAYEDSFRGGVYVAAGDVDGDGYADIVTGTGVGGGPRVRVFSGRTGAVLSEFFAYEDSFRGGVLVGAADFDGDGRADVAAGTGPGGAPRVRVFSPLGGREVGGLFAYDPAARGGVFVAGADFTGDGKAELVTGPGRGDGAEVRVFEVATGRLVASFNAYDPATGPGPFAVSPPPVADRTPPVVILTAPPPGSESDAAPLVRGAASDDRSGVAAVEAAVDGGPFAPVFVAPDGSFSFTPAASAEGPHAVLVRAADGAGNVSAPVSVGFAIRTDSAPPAVAVTAPVPDQVFAANPTFRGRASDDRSGVAAVEVAFDGGPFAPIPFNPDGAFELTASLPTDGSADGAHVARFRAADRRGNVSAVSAVPFTLLAGRTGVPDSVPPAVTITSPVPTGPVRDNPAVIGTVTDDRAGVALLQAAVDGGFVDVPVAADGAFSFTPSLPLGGSADGSHAIRFRAIDRAGNISAPTDLAFTLDSVSPTVGFGLASPVRVATSALTVTFSEPVSASAADPASYALTQAGAGAVPVAAVDQLSATQYTLRLPAPLDDADFTLTVGGGIADAAGNPLGGETAFPFTVAAPTTISEISPTNGEELVSLTRETVVRFDSPVDPATVTPDSFYLIANGERLSGRIRVSSTERFATFFYDAPLPASTEVRAAVDGNVITGRDGLRLDADGDGEPGGVGTADFRTLPLTFIPGTRIYGFVYDSYNQDPDGNNIPVVGATISLDADPRYFAVTNEQGFFELGLQDVDRNGAADGLPAPEFFVHIDGSTAVGAPAGTVYATLGKPFHTVPGQRVQLTMPMGPDVNPDEPGSQFNIHLPPMAVGDVVPLDPAADTVVGLGAAGEAQVRAMFAADPAKAQLVIDTLRVTYPAGSAQDQDGVRATRAAVIPVAPDRLPAPLPPGVNPGLVISVQAGTEAGFNLAGGSTNFDIPAPVTFPNVDGFPAGSQAAIMSFDHDAGEWRAVGTATVSADGRRIVSDLGVGILAPGWHFLDRLVDVFGFNKVPKEIDAFLALKGVFNDYLLSAPTILTRLNPYGRVGSLALGLTGLQNDLFTGSPNGFNTVERIGLIGDVTGIAATIAGGIAVTVTGVAASPVITVIGAIGVAGTLVSLGADLIIARDALNDLGRKIMGTDPPCGILSPTTPPGELVLAAASCLDGVINQLSNYVGILGEVGALVETGMAVLIRRGLVSRFGDSFSGLKLEINDDASVTVRVSATGEIATDPATGRPYTLTLADLIAETDSAEDDAVLTALSTDPSLSSLPARLQDYIAQDPIRSLENARQMVEWALDNLKFPSAGSFVSVGGAFLRSNAAGRFHVRLPAHTAFTASIFDATQAASATVAFRTGAPGSTLYLDEICVDQVDPDDMDGDGIGSTGERAIGTSASAADTDGDGLDDLAEVRQGLDPLGGRGFPTGVIASLALRGEARSLEVVGSAAIATRQITYVATGSHGLAVVDASNFQNPAVLGQLDLPGDAADVAVDPVTNVAVVAAGDGGLHFVDVSDPMLPRLTRTARVVATQVEIIDGLAFAAASGRLYAYDPQSGELMTVTSVGDTAAVNGMGHEGDALFTLDATRTLRAFTRSGLGLTPRGPLVLPQGAGPVHVSNGVAYIAVGGTFVQGGFVTVDVSNPDALTLISPSDVGGAFAAPGAAVATNGSGTALLVGTALTAPRRTAVDVLNVRDPADTNAVVTGYDLPGNPTAVAIASGIGYVATGGGGLQVVNYLPFDANRQAPTVGITGPAGGTVDEGSRVAVRVAADDDVQVRNVELLLDGRVVANDVSAPFELAAVVPTLASGATTVRLQVRATDTGGNATLSNELTYTLTTDTTPPVLLGATPADGGAGFRVSAVTLRFNEGIDAARVSPAGFTLTNLGADAKVGGGDDTAVPVDRLEVLPGNRVVVRLAEPLPDGQYRLTADRSVLTDPAGNAVAAPVATTFTSLDLDLPNAVVWVSPEDGDWNDPDNWSTGAVPGRDDNVVVDVRAGDVTVTIGAGGRTVRSLVVRDSLRVTGSGTSLTVLGPSAVEGRFELHNGARLVANGSQAVFRAAGEADIDDGALTATNGGRIQVPGATSYTGMGRGVALLASGPGSLIDLPNVANLVKQLSDPGLVVQADTGGRINLSGLAAATDPSGDYRQASIAFVADGLGSALDLSSLREVRRVFAGAVGFFPRNGGTVSSPNLTQLLGGSLYLDGTGSMPVAQIEVVRDGVVHVTGGPVTIPSLTDGRGTRFSANGAPLDVPRLRRIDNAQFTATGSVTLAVPEAIAYAADDQEVRFVASGPGSVLSFPNLTGLVKTLARGSPRVTLRAEAGGRIELPELETAVDPDGDWRNASFVFQADGAGSVLDMPVLRQASRAANRFIELTATNQGTIQLRPEGTLLTLAAIYVAAGGVVTGNVELDAQSFLTGAAGSVVGSVTANGTVRVGSPIGAFTITGDLTFTPTGRLEVDLAGTAPGVQHDQLVVTGTVAFDGTLAVARQAGYDPTVGATFAVVRYGSRTRMFGVLTGSPGAGLTYTLDYEPDLLLLGVV
ncbi:MAG: Ig-like domain-containing protein [Gemmataceae bacterium]|nr:Ig-like domain-containing protein [Gemmataceae bacterium]